MVIDTHAHTFPPAVAAKAIPKMEQMAQSRAYLDGTDAALRASMQTAGIDVSILLPVATNEAQVEKLNDIAIEKNRHFSETGLFSLGSMHPDYENYRAELERLQAGGITGIKLHPAYQNTDLDDIRYLRIIDAAGACGLAVVVHAGLDIGILPHNFSSVAHICSVLKEVAPEKFVLAHMGGWKDWDTVETTLAGENVYLDTAFVLGHYTPPDNIVLPQEETAMLSDEPFQRLCEKHGYDKILFATDSPWSDQTQTLERVKTLLPPQHHAAVLGENAATLYHLPIMT